ncbi:hypothetical protein BDK51DRAFT_7267, partial [Blyttiomyces helicus]
VISRTSYNPLLRAPEPCDWLTVFVAQAFTTYRGDEGFVTRVSAILDNALNGGKKPGFMGPISVTELSFGEEFPILRDACMRISPDNGNMVRVTSGGCHIVPGRGLLESSCTPIPSPRHKRAEIAFDFSDQIMVGVETQVLVNWPKPYMAALPVSLTVSVVKFSGTLALEFTRDPHDSRPRPPLLLSILTPYEMNLEVRSLLGHRTRVKDLPKLATMVSTRLRQAFADQFVYPRAWRVHLPMTGP